LSSLSAAMAALNMALLLVVSFAGLGGSLKLENDMRTPALGTSYLPVLLEEPILPGHNSRISLIQESDNGPASGRLGAQDMMGYFNAYVDIYGVAKFQKRRAKELFVFHAPKTGSSFYYSVWTSACPRLPKQFTFSMDTVWDSPNNKGPEVCDTLVYPNVCDHFPYESKYKGKTIGLFRDPKKRLISEYLWGKKETLDGYDIGGGADKGLLLEAIKMQKGGVLYYAQAARGMQTRLLLHESRERVSDYTLTDEDVKRAIDIVKNEFAFAGITDDWLITIFRYHAFMGGLPLYSEFDNVRNSAYSHEEYLEAEKELDASGWEDPYDGPLYDAIVKLVKQDSRKRFQKPCQELRDQDSVNMLCQAMLERGYIDP